MEQLPVRATLHDLALPHHQDLVGVPHRAQSMRGHHHRLAVVEIIQVVHDLRLVGGVEGVRRLVEEDVLRVLVDGSGDEQSLSLPLAHAASLHADSGVVAQRHLADETIGVRHQGGLLEVVQVHRVGVQGDVVGDGVAEEEALLHHGAGDAAPEMGIDGGQIHLAHLDRATVGLVEALQQLDEGGLAAAALPHDGGHLPGWDIQAHVIQGIVALGAVIAERDMIHMDGTVFGEAGRLLLDVRVLVRLRVDLVQSLQADLGVLQHLDEVDEVVDGGGDLPDDVGERHHHAQRHAALDDTPGGDEGDEDVGGLAEEQGASLLQLPDGQPPHADAEQLHLHALPLPALLPLAVVELDVLHSLDELDHLVALRGGLVETLEVKLTPVFQKKRHPQHIQGVPQQEDAQYQEAVVAQHHGEDNEVGGGEHDAQRVAHQERLDPRMVVDALHEVTYLLGVEEVERHVHQLDEEVGDQGDVYPGVDVQEYPATDEAHAELRHEEHQLGYQDQRDDAEAPAVDAPIDHRLRQEREYQLEDAAQQHPQQQLHYLAAIGLQVLEEEAQALPLALTFLPALPEVHTGNHEQRHAAVLATHSGAEPAAHELLLGVAQLLRGGVGDVEAVPAAAVSPHLVADHEVVLVPVQDAGKGGVMGELLHGDTHAQGAEAQVLGGLADAKHRHAVPRDVAMQAQHLSRVLPAIVAGDHAQRGGATVHLVELLVMWETP